MAEKQKSRLRSALEMAAFVLVVVVLSWHLVNLIRGEISDALRSSPNPSMVKGQPTSRPVPFDAETREQVRDFVGEEIQRQTGQGLSSFGTYASGLLTVMGVMITVALAIPIFLTWRYSREHTAAMESARQTMADAKERLATATKHSEAIEKKLEEVNAYEQAAKERLASMKETDTRMKDVLKEAQEAARESTEAAKRSEVSKRFAQALTCQNEGKPDAAIEEYTRVIELAPKKYEAFNNRGNVWAHKNEHDKAIADYDRAIELNPKCAEAFYNRGTTWAHKK